MADYSLFFNEQRELCFPICFVASDSPVKIRTDKFSRDALLFRPRAWILCRLSCCILHSLCARACTSVTDSTKCNRDCPRIRERLILSTCIVKLSSDEQKLLQLTLSNRRFLRTGAILSRWKSSSAWIAL